MRRHCHTCLLRKGRRGQTRHKLIQNLAGPSEELHSLFSSISPHSYFLIDHAGPFHICHQDGLAYKTYILVAVQTLLRRVILLPCKSLKSGDLLQTLLQLSYKEGAIKFIHSDPGSAMKPLASRSADISHPPSPTLYAATNPWFSLCTDSATRKLREADCIF